MKQGHMTVYKELIMLQGARKELRSATRIQPCPACKHDMEQFEIFLDYKIRSVKSHSLIDEKAGKMLHELDYINELIRMGTLAARLLRPLTKLGLLSVPPAYKEVLDKDRVANKIIREHLLIAKLMVSKLDAAAEQYKIMSRILDSFIRATEFKLSADQSTFFMFDKMIRFFYRTHIFGLAGKTIVGAKDVVSCCMDR